MRLRHQVQLSLSQDGGGAYTYFNRSDVVPARVSDVFGAYSSGKLYLPDTQEAIPVDLGQVLDCRGVFIEGDGPMVAVINGSEVALELVPAEDRDTCCALLEAKLQGITLKSAVPGQGVVVEFAAWGHNVALDPDVGP